MINFDKMARTALSFALLAVPAPLLAQGSVAIMPVHGAASADDVADHAVPSPFEQAPVANQALRVIAGREDVAQSASSNHAAEVTDNSVGDNVRTGDVAISDSAFQNMSGLSVLNINTGNNVAVNAALNVNISMSPQP